jgi:U2 small nuclear ribonucleoprotein B''
MVSEEASAVGVTGSASATETLSKIKPQPIYPPNPTLYLSNIDWSIKKPLLKRSLLALFTRHGKVIEVIVLRGNASGGKPLRGQAWVVFESLAAANAAIEAERGFIFFGKPLMVNYAKEVSDRIAKRDGSYSTKMKERRAAAKRKTEEAGEDGESAKTTKISNDARAASIKTELTEATQSSDDLEIAKKTGGFQPSSTPSSFLLARNIPTECNDMMLAMLFRQYSGYKEVKPFGGGLATIEFGNENEATSALKGLNGFKLSTSATLDLMYGER